MSLVVDLDLARGGHRVTAAFEVAAGETVALVGPNGAGKSTCLHALAGLLRAGEGSGGDRAAAGAPETAAPTGAGRVVLDGRVLDDGATFVPPERRDLGVVFQDRLLFDHLSALDNAAFGLRARGQGRADARRAAAAWLERVGLAAAHHDKRPPSLSGGQAQRVALARALAIEPRGLLLDEPLAAVDASARLDLRRELAAHLAGFAGPRIVVAHDLVDALALADRMVVLEAGRLVQVGAPTDLVARPGSPYVADLVGVNGYAGTAAADVVTVGEARLATLDHAEGAVLCTIHPRAISLYRERPSGSPRNVWRAPLAGVEPLVDRARVRVGGVLPLVAEVTHGSVDELRLAEGGEVWVAIKATEVLVTPR